jgi:histone arginine demethylase JMJD6
MEAKSMTLVQEHVEAIPIERRPRLTYTEFERDFLKLHRPVVISGALDKWNAMHWTPEYFRDQFPDHKFNVDGTDYRMADFIELVLNSSDKKPAPYLRNALIDRFLPALLPDIRPLPEYFSPNWLEGPFSQLLRSRLHNGSDELYIGGAGGKFPFLHFDSWHTHAFLCQLYGRKEFTAYAPDQTPYLYVKPDRYNQSLIADIENPDYQKYPLFAQARAMRFHLDPGEILFIPAGWWHTARILSPSITVSVNRANASNWTELTRDMCSRASLLMKPVAAIYLTGMRVFRTIYGS